VITGELTERLDACAAAVVTSSLVPGLAVAVADANGVAWCAGYGIADAATLDHGY
jgi:hypothetical protein